MTYSDAIKNGFKIINKNWQLVLVQLVMIIVSCMGFVVFVGIPLAIAFVMFGLDLTEITRLKEFFTTMSDPSEIISRYLGLVIVLLVSFAAYLLVVMSVGLYVFGGSAGSIGRAVRENDFKFSMKTFFSEGKRLFFPLVGFTAIIGVIFIGVAFVLGIFGGGIAAILSVAKEHGATLALFLGIFFGLLLFCIGVVLIVCTIALTLYGIAAIIFKGLGPIKSTKETIKYLYRKPSALWLYCIAFGAYVLASFMLVLLGTPFNLIPFLGTIIAIPYQLFSYAVQSYLGLVIIGTIFTYYFSTEAGAGEAASIEIQPLAEWVTQEPDTSQNQAPPPEPPHQEKEGQE